MQYLDKHINESMLSNQDPSWIPLVTYRNSLMQGADDDARSVQGKVSEKEFGVTGFVVRKKRVTARTEAILYSPAQHLMESGLRSQCEVVSLKERG